MTTDKLYRNNVNLREFDATVVSIETDGDCSVIELDRTAFFPEGGGQSSDTGQINGTSVSHVFEKNGTIYHKLVTETNLRPGNHVFGTIDWDRRFENMQRHCGEHILTGVIFREWGGINRGFHMGDEYMTIDISFEDENTGTEFTWDMCLEAERLANEIIWDNVPMITRHFDTIDEVKNIPVRKKVTVESDITLVGIGSPENGWGCCACCGTHPSYTGQVGLVKIFRIEPNKGMWRIYFEAGRRAFEDYRKRFAVLSEIASGYSAGTDDVIDKIRSHEQKQKQLRQDYFELRQTVIRQKAEIIQKEISDGLLHVYTIDELHADDLRNMARLLTFSGPVIFCDRSSLTALLFSDGKVDCGKLIKDNAPVFSGKGGGRNDSAQAKFSSEENMYLFADAAGKLLRQV